MAKLESYNNLTKNQEDLVKKGFCFGQLFSVSAYCKNSQNLSFKSSFKQLLDSDHQLCSSSSVYFQYKSSDISAKQDFQTNKIYKTTLETTPIAYPAFKGKLEFEINKLLGTTKKIVSGEYTNNKVKGKLTFTDEKTIKLNAVTGRNKLGGGFDIAYDPSINRLTDYNAAL